MSSDASFGALWTHWTIAQSGVVLILFAIVHLIAAWVRKKRHRVPWLLVEFLVVCALTGLLLATGVFPNPNAGGSDRVFLMYNGVICAAVLATMAVFDAWASAKR